METVGICSTSEPEPTPTPSNPRWVQTAAATGRKARLVGRHVRLGGANKNLGMEKKQKKQKNLTFVFPRTVLEEKQRNEQHQDQIL